MRYNFGRKAGERVGRYKEYRTKAALEKAIDSYFRSIQTKEETEYRNLDGKPIFRQVYVIPPTLTGLEIHLKISRDTWARYSRKDHEYHEICADAKRICENWLEEQLVTREKNVEGIKQNLMHNYGWGGDKREVELGQETREAMNAYSMTMADKLAALAEASDLMAEYYQPPEDQEAAGGEDDGADAM